MFLKYFFCQQNARNATLEYSHRQIRASTDRCYSLSCSSQNTLKLGIGCVLLFLLWQLTTGFCFRSFRAWISYGLPLQTSHSSVCPAARIQHQTHSPHPQICFYCQEASGTAEMTNHNKAQDCT